MLIQRYFYIVCLLCTISCVPKSENSKKNTVSESAKYSLAQWTYHKQLFSGEMNNFDFVRKADSLGFHGVEFVNQFFRDQVDNYIFLDSLKEVLKETKSIPVMIMVDIDSELGATDPIRRNTSIEEHKKWILASEYLGCQYTRVNAYGDGTSEEVLKYCASSLKILADYAKPYGITLLVENHGGYSSDADWLVTLIRKTNVDNLRLLADFDNWCMERENGKLWGAPCIKWYDRYQGMDKVLQYSSGLSLKTFEFDEKGNEISTDFEKMFTLIHKHNYNGWLGIEYEGESVDSDTGVLLTKSLADRFKQE